jgi:hypothetical protein
MASGRTEEEGDPPFFAEPRYAAEVAGWRAKRDELNKHAWIGGVLYDLVGSVFGGAAAALSAAGVLRVLAEMEAIESAAARQAIEFAAKGYFGRATGTIMREVLRSDIVGRRFAAVLLQVIGRAESAAAAAVSELQLTALTGLATLVLGTLAAAGTLLALVDGTTTYADVLSSSKAERWEMTVVKPTVRVNPATSDIAAGEEVVLSANVLGVIGREFRYRWRVEGGNAVLGERDAPNAGREIETAGPVVSLQTAPSDTGTITVTVTVTASAREDDGTLPPVGTARATATINDRKRRVSGYYTSVSRFYGDPGAERHSTAGFAVVPKLAGAVAYAVTLDGFTDSTNAVASPSTRTFDPRQVPVTDNWEAANVREEGGAYWIGLSGADGPASAAGGAKAWLDGRFAGMRVTAIVTLG